MTAVPFDHIRDVSLAQVDRLLGEWFPRGRRIGREFKIGDIQGEPGESLSINVDTGRWADFAADQRGYDLIELRAAMRHGGDRTAAALELAELLGINGEDHRASSQQRRSKQADEWKPIVPPPPDAPRPTEKQLRCDMLHEYCGADDRVLCYVRRFEAKGSKGKLFLPLTFGTLNGKLDWHDKAPAAPKPLYRLNALSHAPDAPVLLCEGEKAADAAQRLFPDYVGVSWMGGARADASADLSPLNGRTVFIWPDADQVGRDAAARLAKRLPGARIIDPAGLPEGFDAADLECVKDADPIQWLNARLKQANPDSDLVAALALQTWCDLDLPPQVRFLGDVVTDTSRVFLVGQTGIGKTLLAYAMAGSFAAGVDFAHWHCDRQARVLIVDGEMSSRMVRRRAQLLWQHEQRIKPGSVMIYALQRAEEFAQRFPQLGKPAPLNTQEGQDWLLRLIELTQPDIVIFDNVMSLIAGAQKDEEPWQQTLPLVLGITALGKSQIWLDHTGWNSDRQYGSSTKAWFMDAVGIMRLPDGREAGEQETAFELSFDPPGGKARNRDPDHWTDFAPHRLRLTADGWVSEPLDGTKARGGRGFRRDRFGKLGADARLMYRTIEGLAAKGETEVVSPENGMATLPAIRREIVRQSNIQTGWYSEPEIVAVVSKVASSRALTHKGYDREHKALTALKAKGLLGFSRDWAWLI